MTPNPLINSSTQSSKTPGLKPALAAALASLEVQLDQELTRYRRTRTGTRALNQSPVGNYTHNSSQQLAAITTTLENIQSSVAVKTSTAANFVSEPLQEEQPPAIIETQEIDREPVATQSLPPLSNTASSLVPTTAQVHKEPENILQPDDTPRPPNDYLESSEALLRSLADEQPPARKPSNSQDSLLSPLGIGSMLLLLVASLTLGYIALNPTILSQINLGKSSNKNSSVPANQPQGGESKPSPQLDPSLTPIPKYPNLAVEEFPKVQDPKDIVGLKPKTEPNSAALPPATNSTVALPSVLPQSPSNPSLPNQPPVNPSQANTQIKPSADGFYHLVTDNQSDRTLASIRQIIPDAYLSLDNKLIYLGAVRTPGEVKQQLQKLQSQGIKARVRQP
ncbi:hypothetical protein [Fortiea contorta]|uniref:hypothetical protein n=1 Tax=Fortiea contorta TaxID=1892405 RepID=UPI000349DF8D|nr:hypothetical protein [Fortiea contorta]